MGEPDSMVSRFKQVMRQTREDDAEYQDLFAAPARARAPRSVLAYDGPRPEPRGDKSADTRDKKPKIRAWMIALAAVLGLVVLFIVFRTLNRQTAAHWLDKLLRREPAKAAPCGGAGRGGDLSAGGLPAFGSTHAMSQYGPGATSPLRPPPVAAPATVWSPDMYTADPAMAAPAAGGYDEPAGPGQGQGVSQAPAQDDLFTPDPAA